MQPGNVVVPQRRCIATTYVFFMCLILITESSNNSQIRCSKTCVAENCNSVGIKYGKYCGVGWTGCPGEEPCDDLDACCKIHDECVEKKGLINIKCHEKFKRCIKKVQKFGKVGFSNDCPYDIAVPIMVQGKLQPWSPCCETKGLRSACVGGSSLKNVAGNARRPRWKPSLVCSRNQADFFSLVSRQTGGNSPSPCCCRLQQRGFGEWGGWGKLNGVGDLC
ncbi:putative phospholipase A2-1-like protein [Forsythia ovata]|uniref:Phospholipase A2-1-like protein n=1 Tax=Forsythia ovata TaxID=205694 RepID=A0ABD1SKP4_9LAMI